MILHYPHLGRSRGSFSRLLTLLLGVVVLSTHSVHNLGHKADRTGRKEIPANSAQTCIC